jgi:DNA-binding transcriptional LysR family regulator
VQIEPQIEVEYVTAALELCARGLGDTVTSQQMIRARGLARKLGGVRFEPPLYDTFAFITRRNAHLSPASREFMRLAEKRVQALQPRLS